LSSIFKISHRNIFIGGFIVFIITAIFSSGSYHPDEHFQILEFANYKLGNSPVSDLPWEFHEKIRPALQPTLAVGLLKLMGFIGIKNPFTCVLILRLLTAILSWVVLVKLSQLMAVNFKSERTKKIYFLLTFFLWFVPLLAVRFSSENYSSITFFAAIYLILRFNENAGSSKISMLALSGLLLGFSFFFRFQIGFAIIGLVLWIIFIGKIKWKHLWVIAVSGMASIAICLYIDYWFYGEFELTALNYFKSNIVDNKAANWGTNPWWFYFLTYFQGAVPPLSIFLAIAFFIGLFKNPKNIFLWCMIPFLVVHFMIGHKEIRFLFPMTFGFIYLVSLGLEFLIDLPKWKIPIKFIFPLTVLLNSIILLIVIFTATESSVKYYQYMYKIAKEKEVVILCKEKHFYDYVGLTTNIYKSPNIQSLVVKNDHEVSQYLDSTKIKTVYILERSFASPPVHQNYQTNTAYCIFPPWIIHFNFNNWMKRSRIWKIFLLERTKL